MESAGTFESNFKMFTCPVRLRSLRLLGAVFFRGSDLYGSEAPSSVLRHPVFTRPQVFRPLPNQTAQRLTEWSEQRPALQVNI